MQSLPSSFCRLSALQTLDLYSNQLVNLPPSFYQLKKLKWLDLKNNPLEAGLKEAAGTCASPRECLQCATRVSHDPVEREGMLSVLTGCCSIGAGLYEVPSRKGPSEQPGEAEGGGTETGGEEKKEIKLQGREGAAHAAEGKAGRAEAVSNGADQAALWKKSLP